VKTKRIISYILKINPHFHNAINYTRRFISLFFTIRKIDNKSKYEGIIGENCGFAEYSLSKKSISLINNLYKKQEQQNIVIDEESVEAFNEIFKKIKTPILNYIGNEVRLDGINFMIRSREDINNKKGFSSNWHTDNVGCRLKVFICFQGDGTQPTLIIQPRKIIPSIKYIIYGYMLELLRWLNFSNKFHIQNQIRLNHKQGSIIILDTQLLHRGCWEQSNSERHLMVLEFSNFKKLNLMKGILEGPIGTKYYNSFSFHERFLKAKNISNFIDMNRVRRKSNYLNYISNQDNITNSKFRGL